MGAIYQPLSANGLMKPAGQCGIQLEDKDVITPFGHATAMFKQSSTKSEIRTPESPGREIIATDYSDAMASVEVEFANMNDVGKAIAFAANVTEYVQPAVAARTQTFRGVRFLDWLELKESDGPFGQGLINTVVTAVTVGGEPIASGAYRHDSKAGAVQITFWPQGASIFEDVEVTFSAPQVTQVAGVGVTEILQHFVVRGRFFLRQNNIRGLNRKMILPKVAFGGDGSDVALIQDGTDVVKVKATGTVEPDYNQPPGREFGYLVDLV